MHTRELLSTGSIEGLVFVVPGKHRLRCRENLLCLIRFDARTDCFEQRVSAIYLRMSFQRLETQLV